MEYQYNGAPHQYTEKAMEKRIRKLGRQIRKHRGFDIMITHAPAYRINDSEELLSYRFQVLPDNDRRLSSAVSGTWSCA